MAASATAQQSGTAATQGSTAAAGAQATGSTASAASAATTMSTGSDPVGVDAPAFKLCMANEDQLQENCPQPKG